MLDERLADIVRFTRKELPRSKIFTFTNGDLLTESAVNELDDAGIDRIFVSAHDAQTAARIEEVRHGQKDPRVTTITRFYELAMDFFHNYGGLVCSSLVSQRRYPHEKCDLPFQQLGINYRGDVGICCLDDMTQVLLGNIDSQPIREIFNGERIRKVRSDLLGGRRHCLILCKDCSFFGKADKIQF